VIGSIASELFLSERLMRLSYRRKKARVAKNRPFGCWLTALT
jgi:hypothetical protein